MTAAHPPNHAHPNYVKIWAILLVLLVVSVAGPFLEIPIVTLITAFGIALVKAYLVIKHFMHLNLQPRYVAMFLATALAFMFLFWFAVAPDVMKHDGANWQNVAAKKEVERGLEHARELGQQHGENGGHEGRPPKAGESH